MTDGDVTAYFDNVSEFMCEIVFATRHRVDGNGRTHGRRRHWQHHVDHPVGTSPFGIEAQLHAIVVAHPFENTVRLSQSRVEVTRKNK